jgi:hypothetical protein
MELKKFKAATVQTSPVFLNVEKTVDKAISFIKEASNNGAKLIAFPEVFIAGYPYWNWIMTPVQGSKWYEELYKNSVDVAGPEIKKLCLAAKDNDIHIVMGINERGKSYGEIASESRSMHKSQGFGVPRQRGQSFEYFTLTSGEPMQNDMMDGVPTGWQRVDAEAIQSMVNALLANYSLSDPAASVKGLVALYHAIEKVKDPSWKKQKQEDINKILLKKMDELYLQLAQNEILLDSLTKNLSVTDNKPSKKSVTDEKPSKKPIKVDVSDDDEPAFNSIPEAHKKLFKTIIKQEAKRNITETTNTMSESEESDSEFEIDANGNII